MAKKPFFYGAGKILKVSFGTLTIAYLLFMIFNYYEYIPVDKQGSYLIMFMSYALLTAVVFGNADIRNVLFKIKATTFLKRFALHFIPLFVIFYLIMSALEGVDVLPFRDVIVGLPIYIILTAFFIYAVLESAVWQGYLDNWNKSGVGVPWSSISAGIFHLNVWPGPWWLVVPTATIWFMCISYYNHRFKKFEDDIVPAVAFHTAFELAFLLILTIVGGAL